MVMDPSCFPHGVDRWVALRTPARWEKRLADALAAAEVPVYLPLMTRLTVSDGRRRAARVPVFGGYLFCSELDFLGNKSVPPATRAKIAQVLRPPAADRLRAELEAVADLLADRELIQERTVGRVGDVVRITGGSMAGYEGPIVRVEPHRWQVVLEISFLGARLEVEVDERLVERVSG
jgi:hypothetical protein